jgi:hypothetical protein
MSVLKTSKLATQVFFVGKSGWRAVIQDATTGADLVVFKACNTEYATTKYAAGELRRLADELERRRYRRTQ